MTHHATPSFWGRLDQLPIYVQSTANRAFDLLKADPRHPSLHFKKVKRHWSVRVGLQHRALGVDVADGVLWFWIGTHAEYDGMVRKIDRSRERRSSMPLFEAFGQEVVRNSQCVGDDGQ